MARLTKAQLNLLRDASIRGNTYAVDSYAPLKALLKSGLLAPTKWPQIWSLTDAGRAALENEGER